MCQGLSIMSGYCRTEDARKQRNCITQTQGCDGMGSVGHARYSKLLLVILAKRHKDKVFARPKVSYQELGALFIIFRKDTTL